MSGKLTSHSIGHCHLERSDQSDKRSSYLKELSYLFSGTYSNLSTSSEGMYGEIKSNCLYDICQEMIKYGLDESSVILDLGSGRGVPNVFFSTISGAFSSIGIEKCSTAYMFSLQTVMDLLHRDIEKHDSKNSNSNQSHEIKTHFTNSERSSEKRSINDSDDYFTRLIDSDSTLYETPIRSHIKHRNIISNESIEMHTPKPKKILLSNDYDNITSTFGVGFINEDISTFDNFEGVTHFYSFDAAMEGPLVNNIVYQFQNTKTAWLYSSFHGDLISKYELKDCFISAKIPCRMYVSNEHRNCYVYVKNDWESIRRYSKEYLSKHFIKSHNQTLDNVLYTGSFNITDWDEPSTALDIIKLTKCPINVQYRWYRSKLDRILSTRITRSNSDRIYNKYKRTDLSIERDILLESLANTPNRLDQTRYRQELINHINNNYSRSRTFTIN